jgi:hypothetical protein
VAIEDLRIYYDSLQEAQWFQGLSSSFRDVQLIKIGDRFTNPPEVERLLRYDRPDVVVVVDGAPRLMVEKTSEVPTGHNVTQRFGRMANAVEESVMVVYMLPFKAMKHGTYSGKCWISARLFMALERMEQIHGVPVLAVDWSADSRFELIRDGTQDDEIRGLVSALASRDFDFSESEIVDRLRRKMTSERIARAQAQPDTAEPPDSVNMIRTEELVNQLRRLPDFKSNGLPLGFEERERTLLYKLGMTPEHCRREDPYTGTQFLYDYIWCRSGKQPNEKHTNLVLDVPLVSKARWLQANPNDSARKSAVYYATANIIRLSDGFINCESKVGPGSTRRRNSATLDRFGV